MKYPKLLAGTVSKRQCCGSTDIWQYLIDGQWVTKSTTMACLFVTQSQDLHLPILPAVLMLPDASPKK